MTPLTPPTDVPKPSSDSQETQLTRARASLRQVLNRYSAFFRGTRNRPGFAVKEPLQRDMEQLSTTLNKLENRVIRISVFGLVSRGKSAVLNALIGQNVLPTGPLNGVTRTPQVVSWSSFGKGASTDLSNSLSLYSSGSSPLQVELIDTPGLDEIDGQTRAQMAEDVARQSDLILFVVAGDITRTEYQAICNLRQSQKPLLLVFNKIDLYPEQTRQMIYQNLQRLAARSRSSEPVQNLLSADEIVLVAADPAPLQVRVERPDGQVFYEWETPPVQIDALKQKILEIIQREGKTLMALNALVQAREAESRLASEILELRQPEAEALIWRYARYKAIAIALNPIAVLDLVGGAFSDLAMIRALAELYGLPITRHEAGKIWKTILLSSGSLLLSELGSGLVLGMGKSAAAGLDSSTSFSAYAGIALFQGAIAGYGAYTVGRAAQVYLEQGCSWGPQGASTIIQDILSRLDSHTIIYRLRQELSQELGLPGM
ncbi:MAG: GTP-binding protein [Leptolyngbyaceae cyanobacterium HOT.MB2.61]|nr:GTP-binding protein [Leptolyngbyaceae cyanobacterium HOT.MB2.61]